MHHGGVKKRICVIGGGRWGENHIRTLYEMGNLGAVVERDAKRLEELVRKYDLLKWHQSVEEAINEDYDGYVVATPAETHFLIGSFLLKHNRNVLIEKPLALNSMDSWNLMQMGRKAGSVLMVGHLMLFHPAVKKIKELVDAGRLGKLEYIYSNRLNFGTVRSKENVFWSFAPNDVSMLNYIIGSPPEYLTASVGCFLQEGVHDCVIAHFRYPGNILGHVFVSWLHPFKEQRLVVCGSKGMLVFEDTSLDRSILFFDRCMVMEDGKPIKKEGYVESIIYEPSHPLENELRYFIEHLDTGITVADGKNGHETVKILEKVAECLKTDLVGGR
ncbi:MAG: Gfo/Idh/MocA family protein [Acetivibrionales bacterium]|jgi:predicted dehydrogenase